MIGAHKWISSWEPAVKSHGYVLNALDKNPIDDIWVGEDRKRNQDPLEIHPLEFAGAIFKMH